jgi:hypothetical protein
MGLLSKAAADSFSAGLDEMGKAFCSRLLSLVPDGSRAETAISLLKAYGSFQAGSCLFLRGEIYNAYASTGMGNSVVLFSRDGLRAVPGKKYYSVNYTPEKPGASLRFWAFPLPSPLGEAFPRAILMVGEDQNSFNAENIEAVLEKTGEVFLPQEKAPQEGAPQGGAPQEGDDSSKAAEQGTIEAAKIDGEPTDTDADMDVSMDMDLGTSQDEKQDFELSLTETAGRGLLNRIQSLKLLPQKTQSYVPVTALEKSLMEILDSCHEKFGSFQGVIIEALRYSVGEFTGRIGAMVSAFGIVQGITPGRCLVIFGITQDGELIARHLVKTVPGKNIFSFRAEDPQRAFDLLKPYL